MGFGDFICFSFCFMELGGRRLWGGGKFSFGGLLFFGNVSKGRVGLFIVFLVGFWGGSFV